MGNYTEQIHCSKSILKRTLEFMESHENLFRWLKMILLISSHEKQQIDEITKSRTKLEMYFVIVRYFRFVEFNLLKVTKQSKRRKFISIQLRMSTQ